MSKRKSTRAEDVAAKARGLKLWRAGMLTQKQIADEVAVHPCTVAGWVRDWKRYEGRKQGRVAWVRKPRGQERVRVKTFAHDLWKQGRYTLLQISTRVGVPEGTIGTWARKWTWEESPEELRERQRWKHEQRMVRLREMAQKRRRN